MSQRGVALIVSLLVLLVLGVIATTVARTGQLQLYMAGNDETGITAMQQALAGADSVLAGDLNRWTSGPVGYRICTPLFAAARCDERTLVLAPDLIRADGSLEASVVRLPPQITRLPIMAETQASSTVHYRAAKFEVQVAFDGAGERPGRAWLAQGVLVRLPVSQR